MNTLYDNKIMIYISYICIDIYVCRSCRDFGSPWRYDNTYPTFVLIYLGRAGILEHPDGEFWLSWRTIQENPGLERF